MKQEEKIARAFWTGWFAGWYLLFTIIFFAYDRFKETNNQETFFLISQMSLSMLLFYFLNILMDKWKSYSTELLRSKKLNKKLKIGETKDAET